MKKPLFRRVRFELALVVVLVSSLVPVPAFGSSAEQVLWTSSFGGGTQAALASIGDGAPSTGWNGRANSSFGSFHGRDAWHISLPRDMREGVKVRTRLQDLGVQPRAALRLQYDVFIPSEETLELDLKLPGFASAPSDQSVWYASSGGTKQDDSASLRLHARPAGNWGMDHHYLEAYTYAHSGGGKTYDQWGLYWRLAEGLNATGPARGDEFGIPVGEWFTVAMEAEMNSPGRTDGELRVWLNGRKGIDLDDLSWVRSGPYEWTQTMFETFYNSGSHAGTTVSIANMQLSTTGPEPTTEPEPERRTVFTDVAADSLHRANVVRLHELGILRGLPNGAYRPKAALTRGQMASVIARGMQLPASSTDLDLSDVSASHTHAPGIRALAAAGIALGYPDGTFRPDEPVQRDQLASFLARALGLVPTEPTFSDVLVDSVHRHSIGSLQDAGIALGNDGAYYPRRPIQRDQAASLLARSLGVRSP